MGKRRVEMRKVKPFLWGMFIGVTVFFILFFVERTSIVAAVPQTVQERISLFEKMKQKAVTLKRKAVTLKRQITPKKRKPKKKEKLPTIYPFLPLPEPLLAKPQSVKPTPEIQTLFTELGVKTLAQAIQKVKGLDDLFEELEAKNPEEALKNFETILERVGKIIEAIAIAVDLDIDFDEDEPIAVANKILEGIYLLKSMNRQMMEMSPKLAKYIKDLEKLLQGAVNAKYSENWDTIWDSIPDDMPKKPF